MNVNLPSNEMYDYKQNGYVGITFEVLEIPSQDKWIWTSIVDSFPNSQERIFEYLWESNKDNIQQSKDTSDEDEA